MLECWTTIITNKKSVGLLLNVNCNFSILLTEKKYKLNLDFFGLYLVIRQTKQKSSFYFYFNNKKNPVIQSYRLIYNYIYT